jgi:hypothetical protein
MAEKVCSACKASMPLDAFGRNRSAKDGLQHRCKHCKNAADRAERRKHPERVRERSRRAGAREREKHPERIKERARKERERDPERVRARVRRASAAERRRNPERVRERRRATYHKHRDRYRATKAAAQKAERLNHPERVRARQAKANRVELERHPERVRARRREHCQRWRSWACSDDHREQDIYERCGGCCAYCGKPQDRNMRGPWTEPGCWQVDHIGARCRGGNNVLGNAVVACSACHKRKHANPQHLLPVVIALQPPTRTLTAIRHVAAEPFAPDGHSLADLA